MAVHFTIKTNFNITSLALDYYNFQSNGKVPSVTGMLLSKQIITSLVLAFDYLGGRFFFIIIIWFLREPYLFFPKSK